VRIRFVMTSVVLVGLVAVGVASAAVGSDDGEVDAPEATTTTSTSTTTTTTTSIPQSTEGAAPVPTDAESSADDSPDGIGTERSTEGCGGETFANHGQYVKSVAQDPDRAPGAVPAAAQSPCGKPLAAVGEESDDATGDATGAPVPEDADDHEAPAPSEEQPGGSPGQVQGQARGRSK
jgi:hypothetical protein